MAPSFDIQPSRGGRSAPKPVQSPPPARVVKTETPVVRTVAPVKTRTARPKKKRFSFFGGNKNASYTRAPQTVPSQMGRPGISLRDRRKARRRRQVRTLGLLVVASFVVFVIATWQAPFRVVSISAEGVHQEELVSFAKQQLSGTRHLIFPKDSILFIPRDELRAAILAQFPDIEAVSLNPESLTALHIAPIERASAFWWCGTAYSTTPTSCYEADTSGKIFRAVEMPASASTTSATTTEIALPSLPSDTVSFRLFGSYAGGQAGGNPIGGTMDNHYAIPQLFRFIKAVKALGADVVAAQIRGDEADLYTSGGTRITYVLGKEDQALGLAASAFPLLDVGGSSLLYIDLRFASKVYFKKKQTDTAKPAH